MEFYLTNQELHEFAQWFSFHYKNDEIGEREDIDTYINTYPRVDVFDLVDGFIKAQIPTNGDSNAGFTRWFAKQHGIYGDCNGRAYQDLTTDEIINKTAKTSEEWIDQHLEESCCNGLIHHYYQDKIKGSIFQVAYFEDMKKQLETSGIRLIDENENEI